jgi:hypothetical protein
MNWLIFIGGLAAALCTIGHFFYGSKQYLKPMLQASFDDIPKKVMHCVFHYISAYLVLSTLVLLAVGLGYNFNTDTALLVKFIAMHYAVFAITQIVIAATSNIPNGVFKLFQWVFFAVIAIFSWIGAA